MSPKDLLESQSDPKYVALFFNELDALRQKMGMPALESGSDLELKIFNRPQSIENELLRVLLTKLPPPTKFNVVT